MFSYIKNRYNPEPELVLNAEQSANKLVCFIEVVGSPFYRLPKNIYDFYASRSKKFWYNVKRQEKMFVETEGELRFRIVQAREELIHYLPHIYTLFNDKWKTHYTSSSWKTKEGFSKYGAALLELAQNDEAELAILERDNECLAYGYCLRYDDTYYFYQHTATTKEEYKRYSLGKLFLIKLIEYVIGSGKYKYFDFMTGITPYKMEWAQELRKVYLRIEENRSPVGYSKFIFRVLFHKGKFFIVKNSVLRKSIKNMLQVFLILKSKLILTETKKGE